MTNSLQFLGAAGTVTGSKYLLEISEDKFLIDAGVFQGGREWREKNWDSPPFDPSEIKAVLLTHAHIDHTGFLPRLYKLGLRCPVYATKATTDLCKLLLPDMGHLQEDEAKYRAKRGKSRHNPPEPLFTQKEAEATLTLFKPIEFHKEINILDTFKATWNRMGHILGAGSINIVHNDFSITFSGDIGRYTVPILKDPEPVDFGDLLLIESTYGDKIHKDSTPKETLKKVINETFKRGGTLIIPSFAVGRAQSLLYYIRELKEENSIPDVPVILDSPMACDATSIYRENPDDYDKEALEVVANGKSPFVMSKQAFIKEASASKKINAIDDPMIIISASGMLYGGRILHHLAHKISDPKNTVLFVGYQPRGSRGEWILAGNKSVKLFGDEVPIKAQIEKISGFSAHGDMNELLKWCEASKATPSRVAVVHGEADSAKSFSNTLKNKFGWNTFCAEYLQKITL